MNKISKIAVLLLPVIILILGLLTMQKVNSSLIEVKPTSQAENVTVGHFMNRDSK